MTSYRITVEAREDDGAWGCQGVAYLSAADALVLALALVGIDPSAFASQPAETQARVVEALQAGDLCGLPGTLH